MKPHPRGAGQAPNPSPKERGVSVRVLHCATDRLLAQIYREGRQEHTPCFTGERKEHTPLSPLERGWDGNWK